MFFGSVENKALNPAAFGSPLALGSPAVCARISSGARITGRLCADLLWRSDNRPSVRGSPLALG